MITNRIFTSFRWIFPILFLLTGIPGWPQSLTREALFLKEFRDPPREFSVMPFWFWNDDLQDQEIIRQIADFENHGVYGFVIHPRIGLPQDIGWMSPRMIHAMRLAIEEAKRRRMYVVLYDEGMYPSGSASGQVVARNPNHAARGLAKLDLKGEEKQQLQPGWKLVKEIQNPDGKRMVIVERPSKGVIRGLHYLGEETGRLKEDTPPAGDILNPEAVDSFLALVYDRFAQEFGSYFGTTILGIFTDEPSPLGRGGEKGMMPGNAALFPQINRILGYAMEPHLADLWENSSPDSVRFKTEYLRAISVCLEENYYRRLSRWCADHKIALTGHPASSMDIGAERYFQIPGQDLVWRYVVPGKTALEGEHSTMAKCASSAMIHLQRRRNANELYGAYGHNLTFEEMQWLAGWVLVRGQNLLYPHAFYYSVRGPRRDERPPDVGPHASWWDQYRPYADFCRRLSWLNTDSFHKAEVAILADANRLPDQSAKSCFQHQIDFNYLELRHLWEDVKVQKDGLHIAGMVYRAVLLDGITRLPEKALPVLKQLNSQGQIILWKDATSASLLPKAAVAASPEELTTALRARIPSDLALYPPSENIRYRHVVKNGQNVYLLFNEENTSVEVKVAVSAEGRTQWLDPYQGTIREASLQEKVLFQPYEMKLLLVSPNR
jgi:hypothetical protein